MPERDANLRFLVARHCRFTSLVLLVDVEHGAGLQNLKRLLFDLLLELLALLPETVSFELLADHVDFLRDIPNLLDSFRVAVAELVDREF